MASKTSARPAQGSGLARRYPRSLFWSDSVSLQATDYRFYLARIIPQNVVLRGLDWSTKASDTQDPPGSPAPFTRQHLALPINPAPRQSHVCGPKIQTAENRKNKKQATRTVISRSTIPPSRPPPKALEHEGDELRARPHVGVPARVLIHPLAGASA